MMDLKKFQFLKFLLVNISNKNGLILKQIINKSILVQNQIKPVQITTSFNRQYSINYKTPTNRPKVFKPDTVGVTKANKHLEIHLFDNENRDLGKIRMEQAKELADKQNLKLVITDDQTSPPTFKLMTGNELYKLQVKVSNEHKLEKESGNKITKEKHIDINLGISDHDLDIKIKMAHNFYDKGHPITIKVLSKVYNKNDKDLKKLQEEMLEKLKKLINFAKIQVNKQTEYQISIQIDSKNSPQEPKK